MSSWSLRSKLLIFSLFLLLLALGGMFWVASSAMQHASTSVVNQVSASNRVQVNDIMDQAAFRVAGDVESYLNRAFGTSITMNHIIRHGMQNPEQRLSRDQVQALVRQALEAEPLVSATYIIFEPNGYGDDDQAMLGSGEHTSSTGTLSTYWVREQDELTHYSTGDPSEKYSDARNELGDRESEWYLCSYETSQACAVEPYLYEIEAGNEVLMTSLVTPLIQDGRFVGVAGVDIDLPVLQQQLLEMSAQLFGGQAHLHLVTAKGRIVASSQYTQHLSRPLTEADSAFAQALQQRS